MLPVAQFRCPTTSKFLASLLTHIFPQIDTLAPSVNLPTIISDQWSLRHIRSAIITDDIWLSQLHLLLSAFAWTMPTLFSTVLHKNINQLQRVQNTLARVVASHALWQETHSVSFRFRHIRQGVLKLSKNYTFSDKRFWNKMLYNGRHRSKLPLIITVAPWKR